MIRVAKLITGDEIIGVFENFKDKYIVTYPVKIEEKLLDNGKPGVDLQIFTPQTRDNKVCIDKTHVLFVGEALQVLEEYYVTLLPKKEEVNTDED